MELKSLVCFVAVAEELSFTRAAERLHMAQPPLSVRIRQLEEELGVALLDRTTRSVGLTEAGAHFLGQARRILALAENAARATREIGEGRRGILRLGAVYSAIYAVVPAMLRLFGREYPHVSVKLVEMTVQQQIDALSRGEIDIGILRSPIRAEGLATRLLFREGIIALVPRDHRLAAKGVIGLADLAREPFIIAGIGLHSSFRQHVLSFAQHHGVALNIVREVAEIHSIISLVGAGLGVSIAPASVRRIGLEDVTYLDIAEKAPPVEVSLAWPEEGRAVCVASLLTLVEHPEMQAIFAAMNPTNSPRLRAVPNR